MKLKSFGILLLSILLLSITLRAQEAKKIALLEPRIGEGTNGISMMELSMVRGELRKAIVTHTGFDAISRTDIDQVVKEHDFQRSGMVSEDQIRRLGEMSGADYICVSTISKENNEFYIEAALINVETGQISNTASQYGELTDGKSTNMLSACLSLVSKLVESIKNSKSVIKITVGDVKFEMVLVKAGNYKRNCEGTRRGGKCDEETENITISKDYYIGKYEITQRLYEAVMDTNPSHQKFPDNPVENVSWNDAKEFCNRLSQMTGKNFSLPTEAEWEYAANGGDKQKETLYSGSSRASRVAWSRDNSKNKTRPVGQLQPNELGIYDMCGNVWEWCMDWFQCCDGEDKTDPIGPKSGEEHLILGGGVNYSSVCCKIGYRYYEYSKNNYVGFRIVMR